MRLVASSLQLGAGQIDGDLGGADVGGAQRQLHGLRDGSPLPQVSREGMPQGVGRHRLCDAGGPGVSLQELPEDLAREPPAVPPEKQLRAGAPLLQPGPPEVEAGAQAFGRGIPQGHEPLLVPLR